MKLELIIEKNYLRIYKYLIIGPNKKYFYKGIKPIPSKIVFYLCNKEVVHLGDTLWYEPTIRFLSKYLHIVVCPHPSMQFYFINLGYRVINADEIDDNCILITSRELMYKLRKHKSVLYLNLDYRLLAKNEKLIDSMIKSVASFFNLLCKYTKDFDMKYQKLTYKENEKNNLLLRFNLNAKCKYIIFSNYIDSWGRNTTLEMLKVYQLKLIEYAIKFKHKNPDIQFIYVGSKYDLQNNKGIENIGDFIDLRGLTDVADLFLLGDMQQIVSYMGFDTFWLHLFNMHDKPSYILLKPGHPNKIDKLIIDHVLVPYNDKNNLSPNLIKVN